MKAVMITDKERLQFVAYLQQEIATAKEMIATMEKAKLPDVLVENEKRWAMACFIVAEKLNGQESFTIGD